MTVKGFSPTEHATAESRTCQTEPLSPQAVPYSPFSTPRSLGCILLSHLHVCQSWMSLFFTFNLEASPNSVAGSHKT